MLSTRHIATALATALGLNFEKIADNLARVFAGVSEQIEKSFKDMEESSTRAADSTIESMHRMASEETKYHLLLQERDRLLRNMAGGRDPNEVTPDLSWQAKLRLLPSLGMLPNPFFDAGKLAKQEGDAHAKTVADKQSVELNKTNEAILEHEKKQREEAAEFLKEGNLTLEEQMDISRMLAQNADQLTQAEKDRLATYSLQSKQLTGMEELRRLSKVGYENLNAADKAYFDSLVKEVDQIQKQIDKRKQLTTATQDQAAAEKAVADAIEAQKQTLEQTALEGSLSGTLISFGKIALGPVRQAGDFSNASPAVIEEEIRRYKELIAQIQAAPTTGGPEVATNGFLRSRAVSQVEQNLAFAMQALNSRNSLRGADYLSALRGYSGDPLNFDGIFHAAQSTYSEVQKTTAAVQELTRRITHDGIRVFSDGPL